MQQVSRPSRHKIDQLIVISFVLQWLLSKRPTDFVSPVISTQTHPKINSLRTHKKNCVSVMEKQFQEDSCLMREIISNTRMTEVDFFTVCYLCYTFSRPTARNSLNSCPSYDPTYLRSQWSSQLHCEPVLLARLK